MIAWCRAVTLYCVIALAGSYADAFDPCRPASIDFSGQHWLKHRTRSPLRASPHPDEFMGPPSPTAPSSIQVSCLGNSIQYYNDCPRLLQSILQEVCSKVHQDSCLRGGASLVSLFGQGNGMRNKFASATSLRDDGSYDIGAPTVQDLLLPKRQASGNSEAETSNSVGMGGTDALDIIILNDHTQSPARLTTRQSTIASLQRDYLPLLRQRQQHNESAPATTTMIVIFLQTPAYRDTVQGCDDLGTFEAFTDRVLAGYQSYVDALSPLRAEIAHVGMAYRHVRQTNVDLWRRLYAPDDFHPSPHGTWLQACVLYYSIWGAHDRPPLRYSAALWKSTRYFAPNAEQDGNDDDRLPAFPTTDEAMLLADVAWKIQCEYSQTKTGAEHDGADGGGNDPSPNANL